jgi:hypothetical protein
MNLVHQSYTTVTGASENINIFAYQVLQMSEGDKTFQYPTINF